MIGRNTTVWAVMRQDDTKARALFLTPEDANTFAQALNVTARTPAARFKVYPWNIPEETFETEE